MSSTEPATSPESAPLTPRPVGTVYVVGAGPGDPALMTVRARALLDECDTIVHDAAIDPALFRRTSRRSFDEPERLAVKAVARGGKDRVGPALVKLARQGKRVVRLTSGDPVLFGHGGEEAQALHDAQVPFEIVPSVPADLAAPLYAGIPVTHPGLASAVTIVSDYGESADMGARTDWAALAKAGGTIVVHTDASRLGAHLAALARGGLSGDVPAAAIARGTTARQRTVVATLETLAADVAAAAVEGLVVAVVGWTVVLRDELSWFERRPLFGRRIVVTRPEPGSPLSVRLRELGADVLEMPTTRFEPLDLQPLYRALLSLGDYQWAVFTSQQAVKVVWETLRVAKRDARAFAGLKLAAVGSATADALLERGLVVDVLPERFVAEGVLEVLRDRDDVSGARVLYPVADGARDTLAQGLRELGAQVDVLPIYRSSTTVEGAETLAAALRDGTVDLVTFTAGSTVRGFVDVVGPELATLAPAASIGPITSAAARAAGLEVSIEAEPATSDGLVEAILRSLTGDR